MNKFLISIVFTLIAVVPTFSQRLFDRVNSDSAPITWSAIARMTTETEGVITITANISEGWHLYGFKMPADGPKPTRIKFITTSNWNLDGTMTVDKAVKEKFDPMFNTNVEYWEGKIVLKQSFKILSKDIVPEKIKCVITYMGCNDATCLPPSEKTLDIRVIPNK